MDITFENHSTSTDNEAGRASGWSDPSLSQTGREQARELGLRRRGTVDVVFCSDLRRAVETAEIAFDDSVAVHPDARLREYDYGQMAGSPPELIHRERVHRIHEPFPGGESFADVVVRVAAFLDDLRGSHTSSRVLIIGHVGTHAALDHLLLGVPLREAAKKTFKWQPGWEYLAS
jgi:broad specificity phosphatase PhoE